LRFGEPQDARDELAEIDGLAEVLVEAGREAFGFVFRTTVGGYGDGRHLSDLMLGQPAAAANERIAVLVWQADVAEQQSGLEFEQGRKAVTSVCRHFDVGALRAQELFEQLAGVFFVFDDQNAKAFQRGNLGADFLVPSAIGFQVAMR
jgi:hypothetical protein